MEEEHTSGFILNVTRFRQGKKMENFIPSSPILRRYDSSLVASHHHTREDLVLCQAAWRQCHGLGELTQAPTLLNPP